MIDHFIDHRNHVIVRRAAFDLDDAEKRAHTLEGYIIALENIDNIIKLIKHAKDVPSAQSGLIKKYKLSEIQAKAILEMRLQKLTGLERDKIEIEYKETIQLIEKLRSILASKKLQMQIVREELLEIKRLYGDNRRTDIVYKAEEFSVEDMIAEENVAITITHAGMIKRFPVSGYRRQARGGKGISAAKTKEDDFVEHMFIASTHHYILFFTDKGRCYWLKVHEIPEGSRVARGKSIVNLVAKQPEEKIAAFVSVKDFDDEHSIVMVTEKGIIKKTGLSEYSNPRRTGITAITLRSGDTLKDVKLTEMEQDIIIGTKNGLAIRFLESEVRKMARTAAGVRAVSLTRGDNVVGVVAIKRKQTSILVVSERGFGKRSELEEYRVSHRGGKGVITIHVTRKTGCMVAIKEVLENDDIVVVTSQGIVIRQSARLIRVAGRNTQGVRLIKLGSEDKIAAVAVVRSEEQNENSSISQIPARELESSSSVKDKTNS